MKADFYLLDVKQVEIDGKSHIEMFGRLKNGEKICILDEYNPYFFAEIDNEKLIDKIKELEVKDNNEVIKILDVEKVKRKVLGIEKELIKIICYKQSDILKIRNEIKHSVVETYEFDIPYTRIYLVDKAIIPLNKIKVELEEIESFYRIKKYKLLNFKPTTELLEKPNVMAIDIETYFDHQDAFNSQKHPILMIAVYSETTKKVLTWRKINNKTAIVFDNEAEMLKEFSKIVKEENPDFIIGYYSDGFDFPYIKERAKINKVNLEIGYNNGEIDTKYEQASIYGVSHIDILKFIRRTMATSLKTNSYKLDEVANELLGEKKVEIDINDLPKAWDNDNVKKLNEFVKYNLQDTKLTYDLFFKIYTNLLEMVNITGLVPGDVNRMGFSQFVEWHIIRKTREQNEIILRKPKHNELEKRMSTRIKGAFVFEPEAGIYDDIIVFDFRSLYPSIITSHNLSLSAFQREPRSDVNVNPEDKNMWFSKNPGFVSGILREIINLRIECKNKLKKDPKNLLLKARVGALKILANSFYGYSIFYGSRWYCLECGETTTSFSRYYIQDVIKKAEKAGFKVIYSDTDSIFLILKGKTQKDAHDFVDKINKKLPEMMELEYEEHYPKGLFVSMKEGKGGAKKRYALCREDGTLKITGFESVRGNTSPIAKEVQEKVLDLILHKKEQKKAFDYVKKTIQDLKDKKIENEKLLIITRISKAIKDYDSIGPHVVVAKKMMKQGIHIGPGSRVEYIIKEGPGIIRDKAVLPEELKQGEYDADYYIEHQVVPAVERILELCGYNKDQLLGKGKQTGLGKFF